MSAFRRAGRALRAHLSYANVMASLAVFLVLGGGAYAATTLPRNSVGKAQIRPDAVGRSELADSSVATANLQRESVTLNRLSDGVRARLDQGGERGATGPRGPAGPQGPAGPSGAGARRIHFDVAAVASPTPATIVDLPGLRLAATCTLSGGDVAIDLLATPAEAGVIQAVYTVDAGADPASPPSPPDPGSPQTGSGQNALPGGVTTSVGGPATTGGTGYTRVLARGIFISANHTITLDLVELINADTGRCLLAGTALPGT